MSTNAEFRFGDEVMYHGGRIVAACGGVLELGGKYRIRGVRESNTFLLEGFPYAISGSDLSLVQPESTMTVNSDGTEIWKNSQGQFHRLDGPAMTMKDGTTYWNKDGKIHRVGGPAYETRRGTKQYLQEGQYHRTDGPAIIRPGAPDEYWLRGKMVTKEEVMGTQTAVKYNPGDGVLVKRGVPVEERTFTLTEKHRSHPEGSRFTLDENRVLTVISHENGLVNFLTWLDPGPTPTKPSNPTYAKGDRVKIKEGTPEKARTFVLTKPYGEHPEGSRLVFDEKRNLAVVSHENGIVAVENFFGGDPHKIADCHVEKRDGGGVRGASFHFLPPETADPKPTEVVTETEPTPTKPSNPTYAKGDWVKIRDGTQFYYVNGNPQLGIMINLKKWLRINSAPVKATSLYAATVATGIILHKFFA